MPRLLLESTDPELVSTLQEQLRPLGHEVAPLAPELQAVRDRNAALEKLHREQRELTTFVVHDLKNPLSVVMSNLELVLEQVGAKGLVAEATDEAIEATKRLRTMIDDILVIARLEDSAFPVANESVSLTELLREVAREYTRAAGERQIELFASESTAVHVRTDRGLLQRILENVIDNSLRHTPARGRVSLMARAEGDVRISVSHSGAAIPVADRQRMFEKFARLEPNGKTRSGPGLGLYFCRRAAVALGGDIEVLETPEWPTQFVVRLPAA